MGAFSIVRTVPVEHCAIECRSSFDEVHAAVLANVPELKHELWDMLVRADTAKIELARREWTKLWLLFAIMAS